MGKAPPTLEPWIARRLPATAPPVERYKRQINTTYNVSGHIEAMQSKVSGGSNVFQLPVLLPQVDRLPLEFPGVSALLKRGVVEPTGFRQVGLQRRDLFICNVLKCLPPKSGKDEDGAPYPTGPERKKAEACCVQWSRLHLFNPTIAVVSLHPAGIIREVSPLPLQCKSIERAVCYMRQGERVLVLCGGKAAKWWLGYAENVQKWVGSYHWETDRLRALRAERLQDGLTIDLTKKPRKKKAANV